MLLFFTHSVDCVENCATHSTYTFILRKRKVWKRKNKIKILNRFDRHGLRFIGNVYAIDWSTVSSTWMIKLWGSWRSIISEVCVQCTTPFLMAITFKWTHTGVAIVSNFKTLRHVMFVHYRFIKYSDINQLCLVVSAFARHVCRVKNTFLLDTGTASSISTST